MKTSHRINTQDSNSSTNIFVCLQDSSNWAPFQPESLIEVEILFNKSVHASSITLGARSKTFGKRRKEQKVMFQPAFQNWQQWRNWCSKKAQSLSSEDGPVCTLRLLFNLKVL